MKKRSLRRSLVVWGGYVLIVGLAVPWYVPPGSFRPLILGLPYWAVVSIAASLLFACWTAFVILRFWDEPGSE